MSALNARQRNFLRWLDLMIADGSPPTRLENLEAYKTRAMKELDGEADCDRTPDKEIQISPAGDP